MNVARAYFSRKWFLTTVLVFVGTAICVRLGIWQLDRLEQRRLFNTHYLSVYNASPILLDAYPIDDITKNEYREVIVHGKFDPAHNMVLRNQYFDSQPGYFLLTPLVLSDGSAILIERGWIPLEGNEKPEDWQKYNDINDLTIKGIIRQGSAKGEIGGISQVDADEENFLHFWTIINLDRISEQMPYKLVPVFVQPVSSEENTSPPYPYQPKIEISEGPHIGYAIQWFFFASLLFCGYPFFLKKQLSSDETDGK